MRMLIKTDRRCYFIPTPYGQYRFSAYKTEIDGKKATVAVCHDNMRYVIDYSDATTEEYPYRSVMLKIFDLMGLQEITDSLLEWDKRMSAGGDVEEIRMELYNENDVPERALVIVDVNMSKKDYLLYEQLW